MPRSFDSVFYGAAGTSTGDPVDDEFNRVSFLSHFDGANNGVNNAFDDGSASNHTITANGNVTQGSFGPFARPDGEWGVSFDGDSDYLQFAESSDFAFGTGDFTFECFFFMKDAGTYDYLMTFGNNTNADSIGLYIQTGLVKVYNGGVIVDAGSTTVTLNTWHHVAVVRISSTLKMYLDGNQVHSVSNSSNIASTGGANIARWGLISDGQYFNGVISNARVVKGTGVYTGNFTPSTSKLTAITNTKLLTCQSNRFVDNSASAHTVTPYVTSAITSFGPFLTSEVYDPASNAASAYFDNSSGTWLTAATSSDFDLGTGDFTIECWINNNATGEFGIVGDMANTGATDSYCMWWNSSVNQIRFGTAGLANMIGWGITQTLNAWNHIAVIRSSGAIKFFYNGTEVTVRAVDSGDLDGATFNAPTPMYIGAFNDGSARMKGYMSDVRVVKGTAVYTGNFTPPTAPLTAVTNTKLLLNMADGQAIDSAAQNNLTLYGNAKISTGQAKFGDTSIVFDGTGDYAFINNGFPAIGTGDFTVEFWMNPSEVSGDFALFDSRNASTANHPTLWKRVAGLYFFVASGERITISSGLSVGTWAHVALVRSSGVYKLYLNGTASGTTYANTDALAVKDLYIGARWSDEFYYNGYLDDFRISKMARYTSNFTAPTEPFADKGE